MKTASPNGFAVFLFYFRSAKDMMHFDKPYGRIFKMVLAHGGYVMEKPLFSVVIPA